MMKQQKWHITLKKHIMQRPTKIEWLRKTIIILMKYDDLGFNQIKDKLNSYSNSRNQSDNDSAVKFTVYDQNWILK